MHYSHKKLTAFVAFLFFLCLAPQAIAATAGEVVTFHVAENFDSSLREKIPGMLIKTTPNLYFYIEKSWWDLQVLSRQQEVLASLDALAAEFTNNIYPTLTEVFGSEPRPGVDGDSHIAVFFHDMREGASGYFRSNDEYLKLQVPDSNEREMVYLSTDYILSAQLKVFFAHEFTHLIQFNQKVKLQNVQEETWLNEARADFSSTILGYDTVYEGSNLQRRARDFSNSPSDPLTEWKDSKYDYAAVSMFAHYVADHYGVGIFQDSLRLKSVGIPSLNEVLKTYGVKEDFSQIFTNWTIAALINDCSVGPRYCYLNKNLAGLRISPTLNFLPLEGNSSLSVSNVAKNWQPNWQKIIGGNGDLRLDFSSLAGLNYQVPYVIVDKNNQAQVYGMALNENQKGTLEIKNFGSDYAALIIIPSLQSKLTGFNTTEFTYPYTFSVSITGAVPQEDDALIQKLLAQIESLKKQIADLQAQQAGQTQGACNQLLNNLYAGVSRPGEVICLQQFLKNQGSSIYPEGLVTGAFGSLTKAAVIRFQQRFGIPQTGFVGILTRTKINTLL